MAELAALLRCELWDRCIVAPAFPHQGRVTLCGVEFRLEAGDRVPVANLVALLADTRICVLRGSSDASSIPQQMRISAALRGSGEAPAVGYGVAEGLALRRRGVFGSDQVVTARPLAACGPNWLRLPPRPHPIPQNAMRTL
jgi:hypothetical protein